MPKVFTSKTQKNRRDWGKCRSEVSHETWLFDTGSKLHQKVG